MPEASLGPRDGVLVADLGRVIVLRHHVVRRPRRGRHRGGAARTAEDWPLRTRRCLTRGSCTARVRGGSRGRPAPLRPGGAGDRRLMSTTGAGPWGALEGRGRVGGRPDQLAHDRWDPGGAAGPGSRADRPTGSDHLGSTSTTLSRGGSTALRRPFPTGLPRAVGERGRSATALVVSLDNLEGVLIGLDAPPAWIMAIAIGVIMVAIAIPLTASGHHGRGRPGRRRRAGRHRGARPDRPRCSRTAGATGSGGGIGSLRAHAELRVALDGTQDSQVGPASCQPAAARSASVVPITVLMVLVLVVLPARRPSCSGPTSPPRGGASSPTAASPGAYSRGLRPSCAPRSRSCANLQVSADSRSSPAAG